MNWNDYSDDSEDNVRVTDASNLNRKHDAGEDR